MIARRAPLAERRRAGESADERGGFQRRRRRAIRAVPRERPRRAEAAARIANGRRRIMDVNGKKAVVFGG
ncbi:MAG: hypothetical protein AAF676_05520, partial [Pseudomonadota bacterium]